MSPPTGGELVYESLVDAEVEVLVGLPGTQTLPLDRVVASRDEIRYVMARHETAIPHIAWGYYEACGVPAATITVPGPGDTNAMHGLKNAYEDCVPLIHISGEIDPGDRGKGPIHEIESDTFDNVVKANIMVDRPRDLQASVTRGIRLALSPPYGPVRLGIPSGFLSKTIERHPVEVDIEQTVFDNEAQLDEAFRLLVEAKRPLIYVGGGARRSIGSSEAIRELADALDAPVAASFKGKGVYPEDESRYLGVTGGHLPADARAAFAAADVVLALGTDFDGVTTDNWDLPMGDSLIHVNISPSDIGNAYEPDVALVADARDVAEKLGTWLRNHDETNGWDASAVATACRASYRSHLRAEGLLEESSPAYSPALLSEIREVLPRETIVTTDIGGFRLWSLHMFEAYRPERFITGGSWAGMGIGLPAAVGAKLACPNRPVVSLVGDGGFMMNLQECHTAREEDLDLTVVVSNNRDYGVISKSPRISENSDGSNRFAWESPSFSNIAEGFGWTSSVADGVSTAIECVQESLENGEPTLIDVDVRTDEPTASAAATYDPEVAFE